MLILIDNSIENVHKMIKKISALLFIIALSGCAGYQTEKSWSAIGGSRADGTIKLAYPIALFNNSAPADSGVGMAGQRCKVWGYKSAVAFGGTTTQCERRNSFGDCVIGNVVKEYQCTSN